MHTRVTVKGQGRVSGLLVALALAALACSQGTPTPTPTPIISISSSLMTAMSTATLTPAPAPSATATEVPELDDDTVTEVVATGTVVVHDAGFICSLITPDEAADLLGGAPVSVKPDVDDSDPGGYTLNSCTWLGTGKAIVLSVADTESADAAKDALHTALLDPDVEVAPTLEPDAILGDEVYWGVAENVVSYTVAYNLHAFSLALGGQVTASIELKAKLLELAQAVAGRL